MSDFILPFAEYEEIFAAKYYANLAASDFDKLCQEAKIEVDKIGFPGLIANLENKILALNVGRQKLLVLWGVIVFAIACFGATFLNLVSNLPQVIAVALAYVFSVVFFFVIPITNLKKAHEYEKKIYSLEAEAADQFHWVLLLKVSSKIPD